MHDRIKFVISITICQFAGIIGSIFTASSVTNWYVTLEKPDFTPPGWIFAPIWVILYFLMGISLYLLWISKTKDNRKAFTAFAVQLILNASWSFLFFGLKSPLYGLIDILFLLAAIILTILFLYKISVLATALLVPYLVWVVFATVLNYNILLLN